MDEDIVVQCAFAALEFYPPQIREDILNLTSLAADVGIRLKTLVSFGSDQYLFPRDDLYNTFRDLLGGATEINVIEDAHHKKWTISVDSYQNSRILLSHSDETFVVSDFYGFHPESEIRERSLQISFQEMEIPYFTYISWKALISKDILSNESMAAIISVRDTAPGHIRKKIISEIREGVACYDLIVPNDQNYYNNLVYAFDGSSDISSFSTTVLKKRFSEVLSFNNADGLKQILRMSWHNDIVEQIDISKISDTSFLSIVKWAWKQGDLPSKVGAIILALPRCNKINDLSSLIVDMTLHIREDNLSDDSTLTQLSNLMILVDGELTRKSLFRTTPPYWRRLAAFTHAALLQTSLIGANSNASSLAKDGCAGRGSLFLLQTMVDLRTEPRWHADYLSPSILKAEFLSRILQVARSHRGNLSPQVEECMFSETGVEKAISFPLAYLPGPLEGAFEPVHVLPHDLEDAIQAQLSKTPVDLSSFIALVNSAMVFKLDKSVAELASQALRATQYQIRIGKDLTKLDSTLTGLASVAAATRSVELANELASLVRVVRSSGGESLSAYQAFSIGLISAAANQDLPSWCEFIGQWATELAYQALTADEVIALDFMLQELCRIVPPLWMSCAKAIAALESVKA